MGDGLHIVQLCPFTASSECKPHPRPAQAVPSSLLLLHFGHSMMSSIAQGKAASEKPCSQGRFVMSDRAGGREDLLKPWETSQCAAAMLCSCEHAPTAKRALWPRTRPGTALGIPTAQDVFMSSHVGLSIHL